MPPPLGPGKVSSRHGPSLNPGTTEGTTFCLGSPCLPPVCLACLNRSFYPSTKAGLLALRKKMVLLASSRFPSPPSDVCKRAEVENHDGVTVRVTAGLQGQLPPASHASLRGEHGLLFCRRQTGLNRIVQKVFRFAEIIASLSPLNRTG